jgi:hypothetical protein
MGKWNGFQCDDGPPCPSPLVPISNVFGMPTDGLIAPGYGVPNLKGVFGMGVKTLMALTTSTDIVIKD